MRALAFDKEPAYILHRRPYQETKQLLNILTLHHGHIVAMARESSRLRRELLQLFTPLRTTCSQGNSMFNLLDAEPSDKTILSLPQQLMLGMYVNELLLKMMPPQSASANVFTLYHQTLNSLAQYGSTTTTDHQQAVLRHFEVRLLAYLGYGLQLQCEAHNGAPLCADRLYRYDVEAGPQACAEAEGELLYHGTTLLALDGNFIDKHTYNKDYVLPEAKHLLKRVLQYHLQGKNINTRTIFKLLNEC